VHAIGSREDVDRRIEGGILDAMREAKASGKVRHVGFTGHTRPAAHKRMLERTDLFETCQMPVNVADPSYLSFTEGVLPELVKKNVGVLAMKTLANGGFFGGSRHGEHGPNPKLVPDRVSIREAIHFAWSLPISVLITGPDDVGQLKEKIALARSFVALDEKRRKAIIAKVADRAGRTVEFYKAASDQ
jgi:predicted aldo/keto reductase-like oxidoreductase